MTIKNISALVVALALLVPSIAIAKVDKSKSTTSFEIEEITESNDVEKVEKVKTTEEVETEVIKTETRCRMTFDLKGWSVFYKRAKGTGVIRCDNGQNTAPSPRWRT